LHLYLPQSTFHRGEAYLLATNIAGLQHFMYDGTVFASTGHMDGADGLHASAAAGAGDAGYGNGNVCATGFQGAFSHHSGNWL
tara:strand:- start:18 stop:266 length:249 start_codon:yes stop_codon:yes gene_type:complete